MSVDTEPGGGPQTPRGRLTNMVNGRVSGKIGVLGQRVSGVVGDRVIGNRLLGNRVTGLVNGPGATRVANALNERFRLPGLDDPSPEPNHLAGVCAWAAVLGLGGMAVALRAFIGLMVTDSSWYAPTVITIGLTGLLCTIGAFASVHRPRLPWLLLGVASVALILGWIATGR